ncbi:MAG: helix-turn-helix domain-containing protein [Planctomycetota bacterium]
MNTGPERLLRSDRAWAAALADPASRLDAALWGYYHLTDWHIARRTLGEHLLYCVVRGSFRGRIAGRRWRFRGPGLFWLPPGEEHELRQVSEEGSLVLYNFRFRLLSGGRSVSFARRDPRFCTEEARLRPLAEQIYDDARRDHPQRERRLISLIFLMYSEVAHAPRRKSSEGPLLDETARRRLVEYAGARVRERPTPADLAGVLRLSPDYFARVFRRTFGVSPRKWLVRERVGQAAVRLLDSPELTVSEVAYEFGYEDTRRSPARARLRTGGCAYRDSAQGGNEAGGRKTPRPSVCPTSRRGIFSAGHSSAYSREERVERRPQESPVGLAASCLLRFAVRSALLSPFSSLLLWPAARMRPARPPARPCARPRGGVSSRPDTLLRARERRE